MLDHLRNGSDHLSINVNDLFEKSDDTNPSLNDRYFGEAALNQWVVSGGISARNDGGRGLRKACQLSLIESGALRTELAEVENHWISFGIGRRMAHVEDLTVVVHIGEVTIAATDAGEGGANVWYSLSGAR